MLKVKYTYKYPLSAPVDRLALQVQRDEKIPDAIAMYQTVQKTLTAKKYIDTDKNMWVVEAEVTEEFDAFTAVLKDVPRDGLVAEWLFFEGAGTVLHDLSGNNNHGTIYGMTWDTLPTGKVVGSFDGIDDYIKVLNISFPQSWTIIVWVSHDYPESDGLKHAYIKWYLDTNNWIFFGKHESNDVRVAAQIGGVWAAAIKVTNYELNKFYFVVARFDQNNDTLDLFWQGERVVTTSHTGIPTTGSANLYIGCEEAIVNFHDGLIGLVRIYNRALSETEIREIYELEAPLFGITP